MNSSKGASSLFDKYTSLNNAIESTRKKIQEKQKCIDLLESQLGNIQNTCLDDEGRISETKHEIDRLKKNITVDMEQRMQINDMESQTKNQVEMLCQVIIDLQRRRMDGRLEFRTKCHEFRSSMKRCREELKKMDQDDWFQFINKEETKSQILLRDAYDQFEQSDEQKIVALRILQDATEKRDILHSRSARRKSNLEQQKLQLERIRKSVILITKQMPLSKG